MTEATPAQIAEAAGRAARAFAAERLAPSFEPAALLRHVADAIDEAADALRAAAEAETALAEPRLRGELARTTGQLRAFADVVECGEALDPIIDTGDAGATPPRPDQRRMSQPIGPVAVYAAGNFPFAFGVTGGDTASAWAAGCPVVLKAHPGHPRTSDLTADVVAAAVRRSGVPEGWFSILHGRRPDTGRAVAEAEGIEAVAFTGSTAAGTALAQAAALRPRPIPVFAEMGSLNPLLVTPRAAAVRGAQIAAGLAASLTGSAGQLCTKPGLIALVDDEAGRALAQDLTARLRDAGEAPMLSEGMRDGLCAALDRAAGDPRVTVRLDGARGVRPGAWTAPALLEVRARELAPQDPLLEELFGPAGVLVWCADAAELERAASELVAGTLTATLHAEEGEPLAARLLPRLAAVAGRLVHNGFPTGVTVGRATVHGGPFPATTAPGHTSVGMTAVRRFLRPVGYQDVPDPLLPPALRDANPLGLLRTVDGEVTRAAVTRG